MKTVLTGSNKRAYDAVFAHPISHNLAWRDVRLMLGELGDVKEQPNGHLKAICGEETLLLHPPKSHTAVSEDELMSIRHFLTRIEDDKKVVQQGAHYLVVIDHQEARIFKAEMSGTVPTKITPYDPQGFGKQLHYVQDEKNGQRKPENKPFYDAVIKSLEGAGSILLIGAGTGESSAMAHLVAEMKHRNPELAGKVSGQMRLDKQHMTDDQFLAAARAYYANP